MSGSTLDGADSYEESMRELERRVNAHVWEHEALSARTPDERAAWKVVDDLLEDPQVWATHGAPGIVKLDRIVARIERAIKEARECPRP